MEEVCGQISLGFLLYQSCLSDWDDSRRYITTLSYSSLDHCSFLKLTGFPIRPIILAGPTLNLIVPSVYLNSLV